MPNFIKIGHTVVRYGDLMVFKMAGIRHLGFLKFNFLTVAAVETQFASSYQIS